MKTDWSKRKAENFCTTPPQREVGRGVDRQIRANGSRIPTRGDADDGCCDRNMGQPTGDPVLLADLAIVVDQARDDQVGSGLLSHGLDLGIS